MDRTCTCLPCRSRRWLLDWAEGKAVEQPDDRLIKREVLRLFEEIRLREKQERDSGG